MAINLSGLLSGIAAEVDARFKALRVSVRPPEVSAWSSYGAASGLVTGAAAGAHLFSLRNLGSNLLMVRRLSVGWVQTVNFTAAQRLEFGLFVARSITVAPSGGAAVQAASGKHRAALSAPNAEVLIATTTGLVAGTPNLDGSALSVLGAWCTQGNPLPATSIFSHDTGDHPLLLAAGEGIRIVNLQAMGAAGVGVLYVNAEVAETADY